MKNPLIIISVISAVLVISAGVAYFIFRSSAPAEPPRQVTPPPVEQSAPPAESEPAVEPPTLSFEQQVEELTAAIAAVCASGESQEFTLVITETEINDLAAQRITQIDIPEDIPLEIRSVHLDFETNNSVAAEIGGVVYGIGATIKSKAKISVDGGKPAVEIVDISFGFIPLPQSIKDRITVYITQEIDNLFSQLTETTVDCNGTTIGLELEEIDIGPSKMAVTVTIKPRV